MESMTEMQSTYKINLQAIRAQDWDSLYQRVTLFFQKQTLVFYH